MGWLSDWWNGTGEAAERAHRRMQAQDRIFDLRDAEKRTKDRGQRERLRREQAKLLRDNPDCSPGSTFGDWFRL